MDEMLLFTPKNAFYVEQKKALIFGLQDKTQEKTKDLSPRISST